MKNGLNHLKRNKMTAVEFLADNFHYYYSTKWNDILEQAKEMEKKQLIDAYLKGILINYDPTFKK